MTKPVLIYNVLQSIRVLADSNRIFPERMILDVDREKLAQNVANAPLLATALNPVLGYDMVAQITAKAPAESATPHKAVIAVDFLTGPE